MQFINRAIELILIVLAWIRAERKELMPIVTAALTVLVVAGGVVSLTVSGDELLKQIWACQDEIGDLSLEGWDFCVDLLTKPVSTDDGC
jgi:hypothetical protein